jgi:hypothetical protein
VAGFGSDRVLISGLQTNGALLTTFTNPAPSTDGGFGISIGALGTDRVIIGAAYNNTGATAAGVAYLFTTNGALVTTLTNPIPAANDNFGSSVAAVGTDRVLIGAIAYGGGPTGGAAYLFMTNGTLLTSFTNPTPAAYDYFGWAVAAVGSSRVLVGAYQDGTGAAQAGSAYLFSTNGMLLTTFTNPTPASSDWFGVSVAGVDNVIIGAVWDDTGATDAGSAYLYALPYPPLSITRNDAVVSLEWATVETGLSLRQTDQLGTPPAWSHVTNSVSVNGLTNVVQQIIVTGGTNRFYRLQRPQ